MTADFAFRHFIHEMIRGMDINHYNAVSGPVIPACRAAAATLRGSSVPTVRSAPPSAEAVGTYKGLLVRAEKRFSHRYQAGVSYALQSDTNIYGIQQLYTPVTNLNNWLQNVGPSSPHTI